MPTGIELALTAALAYLLGSIPFGLILTRAAGLGDIRSIGSGNIGATNVLRTGNKGLAAATLALDLGKGAAAVLLARAAHHDLLPAIAAVAAVVGHIFPPWLRFNGGKGVATAAGALLAYLPPVALASGATWLVIVFLTRYSSLAAIVATAAAPVFAWLITGAHGPTLTVLLIALLVLARHRGNFVRLMRGEESRVSLGKRAAER